MTPQTQLPLWSNADSQTRSQACLEALCNPYLPELQAVLEGERCRYTFTFQDTTFYFYHGRLFSHALYLGKLIFLPTVQLDQNGFPCWIVPSAPHITWLTDLSRLPKDITLFYFTLLKELFPVNQRWIRANTFPSGVIALMQEAGWSLK